MKAARFLRRFLGILVFLAISNIALACLLKIDRTELGVAGVGEEACPSSGLKSVWRMQGAADNWAYPNYNGEVVAGYYALFVAFASNAYDQPENHRFRISPELFGWEQKGGRVLRAGGFSADVYYKNMPGGLSVLVAFRGTDGYTALDDWISNLSPITQMLNPWDQYRTARSVFMRVRADAIKAAGGKAVRYYTVGHSLGGGLARHVAKAFPCVSAVTLNSSFISNEFRLSEPYKGRIVDLFEENDPLSKISVSVNPDEFFTINDSHQWYRMYNINASYGQHGVFLAAKALPRIALECKLKKDCALNERTFLVKDDIHDHDVVLEPFDFSEVRKLYCDAAPKGSKPEPRLCMTD